MLEARSSGQGESQALFAPGVLSIVALLRSSTIKGSYSKGFGEKVEPSTEGINSQGANVKTSLDTMRPASLPINVAAAPKLIPLAVIKRSFVPIDILECSAQGEYARLPEETCVSREAPVAIQKQVAGIATKDVIHAQQITIAVPIIIKRTINE